MQVIEFMAEHTANPGGGYFYHHCADLQIAADPNLPMANPGDSDAAVQDATSVGSGGATGGTGGTGGRAAGGTTGRHAGGSDRGGRVARPRRPGESRAAAAPLPVAVGRPGPAARATRPGTPPATRAAARAVVAVLA
jgi:hypothetical protein